MSPAPPPAAAAVSIVEFVDVGIVAAGDKNAEQVSVEWSTLDNNVLLNIIIDGRHTGAVESVILDLLALNQSTSEAEQCSREANT